MPANCVNLKREAAQLFEIDGGCTKDASGKFTNMMCLEPGSVNAGALPSKFSLWSQMGAAGPFTNSKGVPLDGLPMQCVCDSIADAANVNDLDYFNLNVFSPTECATDGFLNRDTALSVRCKGMPVVVGSEPGSVAVKRTSALLNDFAKEGLTKSVVTQLTMFERQQIIFMVFPALYQSLFNLLNRKGHTEWTNILKWPRLSGDTCAAKSATSLAYPPTTFPPYVFGGKSEFTFPAAALAPGLCALYTDNKFFCPAHQNAKLQPVTRWTYDRYSPKGYFANGTIWQPFRLVDCLTRCKNEAKGTAYIGNGPHGILD